MYAATVRGGAVWQLKTVPNYMKYFFRLEKCNKNLIKFFANMAPNGKSGEWNGVSFARKRKRRGFGGERLNRIVPYLHHYNCLLPINDIPNTSFILTKL